MDLFRTGREESRLAVESFTEGVIIIEDEVICERGRSRPAHWSCTGIAAAACALMWTRHELSGGAMIAPAFHFTLCLAPLPGFKSLSHRRG